MSNFASGYIKYVNHLEQINDAAIINPKKIITEVEDSYHENIKNIANNIVFNKKSVKICMLSGPSSSGKTTTAYLLKQYLNIHNKKAKIISMDNFYLQKKFIPKQADGSYDFENVNALDIEKIQYCIKTIVDGGKVEIPQYNFSDDHDETSTEVLNISDDDIIIMEGIHALNPIFTRNINSDFAIKLYVSVKQSIKDANGEVFSPMDLRLVRRIVRDMQFRNTSPEETLSMWNSVVNGEDNYIRPYRLSADYTINSIHLYEPCVFRVMAIPILRAIAEDSLYYRKARELEAKLMRFEPISQELIPQNSILREFIGS